MLPTGIFTVSAILPLPLPKVELAPPVTAVVQVSLVITAGNRSLDRGASHGAGTTVRDHDRVNQRVLAGYYRTRRRLDAGSTMIVNFRDRKIGPME